MSEAKEKIEELRYIIRNNTMDLIVVVEYGAMGGYHAFSLERFREISPLEPKKKSQVKGDPNESLTDLSGFTQVRISMKTLYRQKFLESRWVIGQIESFRVKEHALFFEKY